MTEEQLIQCLEDAGCDKKTIASCCSCLSQDERKQLEQLIKKHRCQLVCKMHEDQKMIDCLDYLTYQIKKEDGKPCEKRQEKRYEERKAKEPWTRE